MLIGLFSTSLTLVVFVYFLYPLVIGTLATLRGRPHRTGSALPSVCIVVAAHQEAAVIADKLENFRTLDYPEDRLRMLVVSDGSTDGTDKIVDSFADDQIQLLRQEPRQGKATALGTALARTIHEFGKKEGLRCVRKTLLQALSHTQEAFTCETIPHDSL